ncbi:unconventional myosin-Ic [Platysternon megacephalum]|uniref:Unconventional myosin-Ic n=1 Tax=Platysternon megacephalum TaxID=55544 RepID=A0A4D9E0C9_9SAUR|nr:unconventional myosin-Ic [Platysternon megacephalum]
MHHYLRHSCEMLEGDQTYTQRICRLPRRVFIGNEGLKEMIIFPISAFSDKLWIFAATPKEITHKNVQMYFIFRLGTNQPPHKTLQALNIETDRHKDYLYFWDLNQEETLLVKVQLYIKQTLFSRVLQ